MSIHRRAAKRDAVERPIINALTDLGATVFQLRQPCDLLCLFRGRWYPIEVKGEDGDLTDAQRRDWERLPAGAIPIVRDEVEAVEWLLSQDELPR